MKKTISVILSFIMIISAWSITAYAADEGKIIAAAVSAKPGEVVDVEVRIENNPGIVTIGVNVAYDSSVMSLKSVKDGGLLGTAMHPKDTTRVPYYLNWENATVTSNFEQDGVIAVLSFEIKDGSKDGVYPVTLSYEKGTFEIYNVDMVEVDFTLENGSITIGQAEPPAHTHTPETVPGKAATCTETGLTDGEKCSVCGEILKAQETIPALGHTEPNAEGKCDRCGMQIADPKPPAHTHTPEAIPGKAATCTETGLTDGEKCSVCGEILKAQETIPALGHTEPNAEGKCGRCGEQIADLKPPAHTHTPEAIPGKAATCTEAGLTDGEKCSVCGEILKAQEEIPTLGHKPEAIPGKAATCTEPGLTDGEKCSVCGEILKAQETIPALGHDWEDDFTVDKEPIEAIPGEKSIHCKRCDARKDITEIPGPGGLPEPMTRTDLMQDAMDRFFRDLYGRESYAWQQNGTSWTSSPVSFEEDITGVYHAEFADTDGDGEDELIAFAIVEVVDDAGNSIYQLVAEGWDVTEDGTVLHDEFIPDHCDTSSLITDPQISPSCWAAVRDQGIAFVHCNTSYDLTDLTFVTNHFCTYTSFANGKFGERTSLEFMLITEEEENLAVSVNGELKFIELTDSDTLADKIAAIRESLADDLLFPVNEEGQSIDTRIEQDVELEIDNDEMFLEVSDCTPALLMDMQEVVPFNLQDAAQMIRVPVTVYDHDGADKILIGFDSDGIKLVSVENADAYENMKVWVSEDGDRYYEFSDPTDWGGDYQTLCYATLKLNRTDFEQSPPGAAFFFASYEYDGEERVDEAGETSPWYFFEVISEPVQSGLRGDANLDGKVLANDARLVLRASAKLETLEGQAFINCDLNGDGKLLAGEARKILRYSAKLESEL